jgi:hypothetical protein
MKLLFPLMVLGFCAQDQSPLPKEPIKDWRYQLKDLRHDPKTGLNIEEITLILDGKEAIPRLPIKKDKEIFDLKGIDAQYFTTPGKGDPKSRKILVKADRGTIDKGARTLKLDDNVRVVRKADPGKPEPDAILTAPSALLHFNRMFECPKCRKITVAGGTCVDDGTQLRETTVTSVETDREFELTGPEGILSGTGLTTDDAIRREYHIREKGFVEYPGNAPQDDPRNAAAPAQTRFTQVYSRGPLSITGPEDARVIDGKGGVRVDRIDPTETMTLDSETLHVETVRRWDLSASGPVEPANIHAEGDVRLDGVSFTDNESFRAKADTLVRTKTPKTDVTVLTAAPPHVTSLTRGVSRIDSLKATLDKEAGVSVFEDVARSDLVAGTQHFNLACGRLTTHATQNAQGKTELTTLDAVDHVVLGGLMPGSASPDGAGDPGEARADHFAWNIQTNKGLLEGRPFVRITQGASVITAPVVVLESPQIMVLKGPKQVRMVQVQDGKPVEYRATCDGDLVLDNSEGVNRLWMRNNCVLRTPDMLLTSDRLQAKLSPDGKGLETLLALGRVRAARESEHTSLYGDRLFYRFSDQTLHVYGSPHAVADAGHTVATQGEIRVFEREDPKTHQMVRYTEMIGDSDGVRIVIEEKTEKDKADPKPK